MKFIFRTFVFGLFIVGAGADGEIRSEIVQRVQIVWHCRFLQARQLNRRFIYGLFIVEPGGEIRSESTNIPALSLSTNKAIEQTLAEEKIRSVFIAETWFASRGILNHRRESL